MVVFNRTFSSNLDMTVPLARTARDPVSDDISYLSEIVESGEWKLSYSTGTIKRVFDVMFAGLALVMLSPVLLTAAILIRLESPGSVFFKQERIGINRRKSARRAARPVQYGGRDRRESIDRRKKIHAGKPFSIYKLRTMSADAEKDGPALSRHGDPRITRIGLFLRRTRIDEIPQFVNVIKGEMSIIGPRPERSFFINQMRQEVPEFPVRLRVKPGITGLAQVENGYADSIETMRNKLFYDLKYISNLSIVQEISILFKTVFVVISGKGAC